MFLIFANVTFPVSSSFLILAFLPLEPETKHQINTACKLHMLIKGGVGWRSQPPPPPSSYDALTSVITVKPQHLTYYHTEKVERGDFLDSFCAISANLMTLGRIDRHFEPPNVVNSG